jgi:D-glycero-D-manno-heptose 1,7-bisphosphate phosphatase
MGISGKKIMRKAVFLDRDGVINHSKIFQGVPYPPAQLNEVQIIIGVEEALQRLKAAGYFCIVITNQPDVVRGITPIKNVEEINQFLLDRLPIDEIISCYHDDKDDCECRKPKPGSILKAAAKYNIDLTASYMVGDRWRDVDAGQKAGCQTFFIDYKYNEKQPKNPTYSVCSLMEAAKIILGEL